MRCAAAENPPPRAASRAATPRRRIPRGAPRAPENAARALSPCASQVRVGDRAAAAWRAALGRGGAAAAPFAHVPNDDADDGEARGGRGGGFEAKLAAARGALDEQLRAAAGRGRGRGAGGRVAAAARPPVAWIVQQADEVATADDLSVVYPESLRRLRALAPRAEGERAAALVV